MPGVEFDYPITSTRHLRSGDGNIPLLDGGLAEREKFSQNLVFAIGGSLLALITACQGSRPPEPSPSSVPQAIITPVSIGSSLPENCLTDSLVQTGFERAVEAQQTRQTGRVFGGGPLTPADNDAIEALNTCAASAKATVEAPSPTTTRVVEIPSTPESEFKFGEYDVFAGDGVVFAALPNGKLLFQAAKPEVTCDNNSPLYKFLMAPPYASGSFDYSSSNRRITGTLADRDTVNGSMSNIEFTGATATGPLKCLAHSFNFTARREGKGQEVFLQAYKTAMRYPATTSLAEIKVIINRATALYGFELP